MKRRIEVFSSLLILAIAIVAGVGFFQYWRKGQELDRIREHDRRMVIGSDESLANAVQVLEQTLKERLEYQFELGDLDPLDLTRVVKNQELLDRLGLGELEPDKTEMRLAATVIGQDGIAAIVIRFMGSNHVLRVGDKLSGWTVSEIGERSAVLTRGGARRVLHNAPANEYDSKGLNLSVPRPAVASGNNE